MTGSPWDSPVYGAVAARERSKPQHQPPVRYESYPTRRSDQAAPHGAVRRWCGIDPSCDALLNHAPSFPHIPKVNIATRAELAVGATRRTPELPSPR